MISSPEGHSKRQITKLVNPQIPDKEQELPKLTVMIDKLQNIDS